MADDLMKLLFGKKRSRRKSVARRKSVTRRKRKKSKVGSKTAGKKKVGWCVKTTRKCGSRCVKVYKLKGKTGRYYYNGRKVPSSKCCYKTKAKADAARKRLIKKKKTKRKSSSTRRRRRRSSFGVGGSYMPLSSMMSPYPYAVNASPPWM